MTLIKKRQKGDYAMKKIYNFFLDPVGNQNCKSQAKEIEAGLLAINDELEIEIHQGDQPVYPYLFSAE